LKATVQRLKQANKQVVLTAGAFEPFTESLVALLRRARTLGDALIVVVYEGASPWEPIAALDAVDYLTVLPENALVPLLQQLQPPYYALLSDYRESDLPAVEAVIAYGGFAVVLPKGSVASGDDRNGRHS
jgi:D-beta-D-heptose 7-phosphate kinase/D-beta-D-heptose 1-phosphate adenosyltransferase